MTRWWVTVNPAAGRGRDLTRRVESALDVRAVDYELRTSETAEAVGGIIAQGRDLGYDSFLAVGGDGTANLVLNHILAGEWPRPPTLGILPAGSGSDFVRTFAIPNELEAAADHLLDEDRYPVDVGRLAGRFGRSYFLNAANAGLGARTVVEAARFPDWMGPRRYLAGFWSALARTVPDKIRVDCDARTITTIGWNVVIANGQFFGGGMNVAPRAAAGDGLFDVQVFSGRRRIAPVVIRRVVRGTHLTHTAVRRTTGRRVDVDIPQDWLVEADGEIVGRGPFSAEVLGGLLDFKI
ncbi:MAG: YegS/Rv2252/BmrU family lipid kinase [Acidimicrobiia bacterium]